MSLAVDYFIRVPATVADRHIITVDEYEVRTDGKKSL
jgi:hypothetical protein